MSFLTGQGQSGGSSKGSSSECSFELGGTIDDTLVLVQCRDIADGFGEPGKVGGSKLGLGLELHGEGAAESFESCGLSDLPCQRLRQHVH